MQNRWQQDEAQAFVQRYAAAGEALALRLYSSRLIGSDPALVLHGGGNTSVKTTARDALGRELRVVCVKGSGHDLAGIGPAGMPAVELAPLLALAERDELTDEAMVSELRRRLLDPTAPDPSIEALLHAFLPHAFVDHTHADAILALTNQPDGPRLVRQALGEHVAILPWIMPGFPLAKAVAAAHRAQPDCRGVVLLHHGLFTFGDTARQSYDRMIELVDAAERFVSARAGKVPAMLRGEPPPLPAPARALAWTRLLPLLRGTIATMAGRGERCQRLVAEVRSGEAMAAFSAHPAARALCATGPITPDHVIRTKGRYLCLGADDDAAAVQRAVADFVGWYRGYFDRCVGSRDGAALLPPVPVVAVVEGCGLCALAPSKRAAAVAADIAEHTTAVWAQGHALGRYQALPEAELAAMEYWPLELRKLGRQSTPLLAGQIALVTGAAGAIGHGTAAALLEHGASVLLVDRDAERLRRAAAAFADRAGSVAVHTADLTDGEQVRAAFAACVQMFGGVDIVVQSHGIAHVASIEQMSVERFRAVVDVNATATLLVLQAAAPILRAQGTGGSIVLQISKNAFAPGKGFAAYSASKAAALQLGRIAALEFADLGVRVNMVNADAVFGDGEVESQLWAEIGPERMRARGLDAAGLRAFYRERSLLKRTVTPADVAAAVLHLVARAPATTGAVLPVDGGLPDAFPR